jgi:predicted RNA-binding protein (virulence factor B family)
MNLGELNELEVLRFKSVGAYLGDEEGNDVLLPNKYIDDDLNVGDKIEVFIYRDSEDRLVATTEVPFIKLGGFAHLKIKDVNLYGGFADWGLEKDLLIPYKEQTRRLDPGEYAFVSLQMDDATNRLYGTAKLNKHFTKCTEEFDKNQEVDLLIWHQTDLGTKAIVNDKYQGMIFRSDMEKNLLPGMKTKGFVQKVREDGKLDLRLSPAGYTKVPESAEKLLAILEKRGKLSLTDKSSPDDIRDAVGMSKKTFKQAVGNLYKRKLIRLNERNIELIETKD